MDFKIAFLILGCLNVIQPTFSYALPWLGQSWGTQPWTNLYSQYTSHLNPWSYLGNWGNWGHGGNSWGGWDWSQSLWPWYQSYQNWSPWNWMQLPLTLNTTETEITNLPLVPHLPLPGHLPHPPLPGSVPYPLPPRPTDYAIEDPDIIDPDVITTDIPIDIDPTDIPIDIDPTEIPIDTDPTEPEDDSNLLPLLQERNLAPKPPGYVRSLPLPNSKTQQILKGQLSPPPGVDLNLIQLCNKLKWKPRACDCLDAHIWYCDGSNPHKLCKCNCQWW